MIILRCLIDRLDVTDVTPRLRLIKGKDHPVPRAAYNRSKILQAAKRKGQILVVSKAGGGKTRPTKGRPRPKKRSRRQPRQVPTATPAIQVDLHEVQAAVQDLKDVHDLFIATAGELRDRPAPSPDSSVLELLTNIQSTVEGLTDRLDKLESVPATRRKTRKKPKKEERTPTYIPSDIRSGGVTETRIEVETQTDGTDLTDAEDALKALKTPKPKKPQKIKRRTHG